MTNAEIQTFIETMEEFGDIWTEDQVKDVYGEHTLEYAINDRKEAHSKMADILSNVINR